MDRETDGWTDGRIDRAKCRVACMQLKMYQRSRMNLNVFTIPETLLYGNFLFGVSQDGLSCCPEENHIQEVCRQEDAKTPK